MIINDADLIDVICETVNFLQKTFTCKDTDHIVTFMYCTISNEQKYLSVLLHSTLLVAKSKS